MQGGHHEKHKDRTSDQGRALVKSMNPMEKDKINAHSTKCSEKPIGTDRESYVPKEKKTMNLDHLNPRQYDIFNTACQKSDRKKKTGLALSKNS